MEGADGRVHGVRLANGELIPADVVVVGVGVLPAVEWLETSTLALRDGIVCDANLFTGLPGVYAAGDVTTVPFKQIVIAVGDGAKAALGAFDHLMRSPAPVLATA
jgi:alkyl hydroperoxide reductase subunit F